MTAILLYAKLTQLFFMKPHKKVKLKQPDIEGVILLIRNYLSIFDHSFCLAMSLKVAELWLGDSPC